MIRELFAILSERGKEEPLGESLSEMMERSSALIAKSTKLFLEGSADAEAIDKISRKDVKVNKLQRKIRKRVLMHLSMRTNAPDLPYCLRLISIVKDVERVGDYAKDIAKAGAMHGGLPTDVAVVTSLRAAAQSACELVAEATAIFQQGKDEGTVELITRGRRVNERLDEILSQLAQLECAPQKHTALVLATQYYRRVCGHTLNVLSSLVTPLHRLDYYDDKDLLDQGE